MSTLAVGLSATLAVLVLIRCRPLPARVTAFANRGSTVVDSARSRLHRASRFVVRRIVPVTLAAALLGPFGAAAVVTFGTMLPRLRDSAERRSVTQRAGRAYPDLVDMLVLSIKSGYTPPQALAALLDSAPPPARCGIAAVLQRADVGGRFAEAVTALQELPPAGLGAIAQPLVDSLALADRYGTPLAPILDRLADEARAQRRRNAEIAARRLPIQLSFPLVGCTLPSFVLLTVVPLMAGTFSSLHGLKP